ncbi:MAG: acyl-CoA reductase [Amphiplicatus sp.]
MPNTARSQTVDATARDKLYVPHVVAGRVVETYTEEYPGTTHTPPFATPALDLDNLFYPRSEPPPAYALPIDEIIDFLVATGARLSLDGNPLLAAAAEATAHANPLGRRVIENIYRELPFFFSRKSLEFEIEQALGGKAVLDGAQAVVDVTGRTVRKRAFPPRLVHILAGNTPGVAASSIASGALTKGVNLLKLPSNDLFTASAILRTMAAIDPEHPVLRSFSAVYWRGGDAGVENFLYRPQFFDKIVVWGGEGAVKNVVKYLGPGIQMIAFDPKVSISMVGREAHASDETLRKVAALAAEDVQLLDQEACGASRFQFVEGTPDEVDRYCEILSEELRVDREMGSAKAAPPPPEVVEEVSALRMFEPIYKAWGDTAGGGLVLRSPEPVTFHPCGKVVNVVPIEKLSDAVAFANPATQTVGVWPPERKSEVNDLLWAAGVQRVVKLGDGGKMFPGLPHDGFLPLHRYVNWVTDED